MKLLIVVLLLLPFAATAQTVSDYNHVMKKLQHFYNTGQGDSINVLLGWNETKSDRPFWSNDRNSKVLNEVGYIKSFKFIGIDTLDPEKVHVFQTVFSKGGLKTTSLTLGSDLSVGTFRFVTTSDGITALLNNRKKAK